jgi:tyrosine-protein kinase Tec
VGSVQVVEPAQLSGSGVSGAGGGGGGDNSLVLDGVSHPAGFPFQVGYQEGGQEYTLYLLANREQDRIEWIRALRAGNHFN